MSTKPRTILTQPCLAVRNRIRPNYLTQSMIGFSLKSGVTWLLDNKDSRTHLLVREWDSVDSHSKVSRILYSYCYIGKLLERLFPEEVDFEIFRLHFHQHRQSLDEVPLEGMPGHLLAQWDTQTPSNSKLPSILCKLSYEHIVGPNWATLAELTRAFRLGRFSRTLYTSPLQIAPLEVPEDLQFLPHPGMTEIFSNPLDKLTWEACRLALPAERVTIQ